MSLKFNSHKFAFFNDPKLTTTSQDMYIKGINAFLITKSMKNSNKLVKFDFKIAPTAVVVGRP